MTRRIGPTLGTGTVIIEEDVPAGIVPAPIGTIALVGVFEKGTPGELNECNGQGDFVRKNGTYFDGTEAPDAAFDFFRLSGGGGPVYTVRVTDGNERSSVDDVWSRHTGRGEYVNRDSGATTKKLLMTVTAKNGGRWAGCEQVHRVDGWTIATDLTETTLDTGVSMLENEWVGARLQLLGVATKTYRVISNTVEGVLTVESDSTMATDLADGGDATNNKAVMYLDNEIRQVNAPGSVRGARKGLGLVWLDGAEDQDRYVGLQVTLDGSVVKTYPNLSVDPSNKWYAENVINQDASNDYIRVTVTHAGSISATNRPADWYGTFAAYSGGTLTAQPCRVTSVASTNGDVGFVTDWTIPENLVRGRITLTFTSATDFDVAFDGDHGMQGTGLSAGTVGTAYAPGDDFVPGFTVKAGVDAFSAGDVITIDVDPFPVDFEDRTGVLSGWVYPDAGSSRVRVGIDDNTVNTITFKNAPDTAPTPDSTIAAKTEAETTIGTAITFPLAAVEVTFEYVSDADGYVTETIASAAYASIAELVAALNGAQTAADRDAFFAESSTVPNALAIDHSLVTSTNTGEEAFIRFVSVNAELNVPAETWVTGDVGDAFRVEASRTLRKGYDGDAPTDADYINAFNTVTSVMNRIRGRNKGLVKIACPGVTTTAIQKAGLAYAAERNYQYRIEIPANIVDEAAAVAYINSTIGRNNYGVTSWPSYGYVTNPIGDGLVLRTLTGAIFGRETMVARNFKGYHKAGAGVGVTIPHMIKSPLGEHVVNEEVTNPQGINLVKKVGGNFLVWGDRTIAENPAWTFKHQREYMSHVENVLLEAFDWLIFAINDEATRSQVQPVIRAFFLPEWQKRAVRGATFEDAVSIKIDDENNTNLTMSAGEMHLALGLRLADTVERFVVAMGKKGIFEQ